MTDNLERAALQIARDLNFSSNLLELIGKILSLEDEKELVRFVELSKYGNLFDMNGELFYIQNSRTAHARVVLQNNLYDLPDEIVKEKVVTALAKRDIDISKIFQYTRYSYGLTMSGIDIHIGGMPLRQDVKLHPRDAVMLS